MKMPRKWMNVYPEGPLWNALNIQHENPRINTYPKYQYVLRVQLKSK